MMKEAGWVISANPRLQVLEESESEDPVPVKEISEKRGIKIEHVSQACSELSDLELVECPHSESGCSSKPTVDGDRVCQTTEKGKHTLTVIENYREVFLTEEDPSRKSPSI